MGASVFTHIAHGKSAKEAFSNARQDALYNHGHGGYTGTIAEKDSFVTINVPAGRDPREYAEELIDTCDPRVDDKWGPAGCIAIGNGRFLFFGWASS